MANVSALLTSVFLTYTTVKLISVPNTKVALVHRLIQLLVFTYTIAYILYWKRGYQQIQRPIGISITKLKYNITGQEGEIFDQTQILAVYITQEVIDIVPFFALAQSLMNVKLVSRSTIHCWKRQGGLIEIGQVWNCNFDFNEQNCFPTYEFRLLDSAPKQLSPGINFRYVKETYNSNGTYRQSVKVYGIRFVITTSGQSGKFDILNTFMATVLWH
ncbi:unnamed protein product [Didymodactylos carnosus]|uniref:Uncharacterized protein n=1 Tax=Didymodactylos carnosus TaxID=1234261 RepID=A0A813TI19_9BILA|nr:unnamed protein product [Didymodactylos carnosus]CAF3598816.1 unnamed protein product [Didymodactylos carnosus]